VSAQIGLRHKASIAARGASGRHLYQGVLQTLRSPHVLSLVNQKAVTDQRCPSERTNSTATKLAITTQGRRMSRFACCLLLQAIFCRRRFGISQDLTR
jgi:hypothetical protein